MRVVYCKAKVYLPFMGYVGRISYSAITGKYFYQLKNDFTPLCRFNTYEECVNDVNKIYSHCEIVETK